MRIPNPESRIPQPATLSPRLQFIRIPVDRLSMKNSIACLLLAFTLAIPALAKTKIGKRR